MSQGPDVGGAWIEIHASDDGLAEEIQAVVEKAAKKAKAKITLDPKLASDWRAQVQALVKAQRNPQQTIDPTLDPNWSEKTKSQTKRQKPAPVPVEPDIDKQFRARLAAQVKAASSTIEAGISVTPEGEKFRRELAATVEALTKGIDAKIPVELDEAAKARADLIAKIEELQRFADSDPVEIPVDVDPTAGDRIRQLSNDLGGTGGNGGLRGAVRGLLGVLGSVPAAVGTISSVGPALGGVAAGATALLAAIAQAAGAAIPAGVALSSLGLAAVTLKVGFSGVGEAMDASAKAAAEFAATGKVSQATADALDAALKNLAPSAREVVSALRGVAAQFSVVQKQVQQQLFAGLGKELVQVGQVFLPILRNSLTGIAQTLNGAAVEFLKFIRSGENSKRITNILNGLEPILANILSIAKPLTDAFLRIFEKSLPFAQQIAAVIAVGAQNFAQFITTATKSGAFTEFLKTAMQLAGQLFGIIRNVGSIIASVFSAGTDSGGGLLGVIQKLTGQLADFLKSAEGKSALANFFGLISVAAGLVSSAFTVLGPLITGIATVFQALQGPVKALQAALLPVVQTLAGVLADALIQIAPLFGQLVTALTPLIVALGSGLVSVFAALLQAVLPLLPVFVQLIAAIATGIVPVVSQLVVILLNSTGGFAQLVQALLPLVPSLLALIPPAAQLALAFAQIVVAMLPLINLFTEFSVAGITRMTPALILIAKVMAGVVTNSAQLITAIANVIRVVVDFVVQVVANFTDLRSRGASLIGALVGAVVGAFNSLPPKVLSAIRGMVSGALGAIGSFASAAGTAAGKVASAIVKAIRDGLSGIAGVFRSAFDSAKNAVTGALGGILSAVEGLVSKIQSAISKISGAIKKIPSLPGGIHIPGFAKGGVATDPTLAAVAESTPELIVPISPNAPLNPGVEALLQQVAAARAGNTPTEAGPGVSVTQNISLPTGDPEAAALAVLDRLAAVL